MNENSYANKPFGRLHRDMLDIAIREDFSKSEMRLYSYLVVNANQYSGELQINPSVAEAKELIRISQRRLIDILNTFQALKIYVREKTTIGIKGNAIHVFLTRRDTAAHQENPEDSETHPRANLIFGKLTGEFVRIAIENDLTKTQMRHYWYICLNLSSEGHLTRLETIPELAATLDISKFMLLKSFTRLQEVGLFDINRPSAIQGIAPHVPAAVEEVERIKRERQYNRALGRFMKAETATVKSKFDRPLHDAEKRQVKNYFRKHFEETGQYLDGKTPKTSYFMS